MKKALLSILVTIALSQIGCARGISLRPGNESQKAPDGGIIDEETMADGDGFGSDGGGGTGKTAEADGLEGGGSDGDSDGSGGGGAPNDLNDENKGDGGGVEIPIPVETIVFVSDRRTDGADEFVRITNIWAVKTDGTELRALTTAANVSSGGPQKSPDGTAVVFESARTLDGTDAANANGTSNIWVVNSDGSGLKLLTTATALGAGSSDAQWSPDGSKVVFISTRHLDGSDVASVGNASNIWAVNVDGTGLTPLTTAVAAVESAFAPQWSPDGLKIIFYSRRRSLRAGAGNTDNIWVVNADGTGLTPLTELNIVGADSVDPQWSPDGTKIVYSSRRKLDGTDAVNGASNIWVMNADGTGSTPLTAATAAGADSVDPQWSPGGRKIVFSSVRNVDGSDSINPVFNIWVVNADGTGATPLTAAATATGENPQWSADGTKIVFDSDRKLDGSDNTENVYNVWILNANGTGLEAVTKAENANSYAPQLRP